ncbi:hypothetical protein D3C76_894240 [compost metagenome]
MHIILVMIIFTFHHIQYLICLYAKLAPLRRKILVIHLGVILDGSHHFSHKFIGLIKVPVPAGLTPEASPASTFGNRIHKMVNILTTLHHFTRAGHLTKAARQLLEHLRKLGHSSCCYFTHSFSVFMLSFMMILRAWHIFRNSTSHGFWR